MNFVCVVFELGDKMLTLSSMENLIVPCNLNSVPCKHLHPPYLDPEIFLRGGGGGVPP